MSNLSSVYGTWCDRGKAMPPFLSPVALTSFEAISALPLVPLELSLRPWLWPQMAHTDG